MPTEIYLVKVGMNMTEGVVEEWYVPDGGAVQKGELLYRLETEKVNLDVDAEVSGTVRHLVGEGITGEPGDVVGYIYAAGEVIPERLSDTGVVPETATMTLVPPGGQTVSANESANANARLTRTAAGESGRLLSSPAARRLAAELKVNISGLAGSGPGGRIVEADVKAAAAASVDQPAPLSSPMARKLARELGVDIGDIKGTGPGGRITKEDVEAAARPATTPVARTQVARADQRIPIKGMRKTIAARMHASLQSMAQLTMNMDVAMDQAVQLREQLTEGWAAEGIKPGYTDLVILAVAKALEQHPQMNAVFGDTEIIQRGSVHVGMAVALEDGLIVPVVRDANRLSLAELCRETSRLADAARSGNLSIDDLQDGTFTVSALGMFGVDSFTPIINAPQVGILGINRLRDDVGWDGERPIRQRRMNLSLTWDHRALDGAPAARFLASVRMFLEAPYRLLI